MFNKTEKVIVLMAAIHTDLYFVY